MGLKILTLYIPWLAPLATGLNPGANLGGFQPSVMSITNSDVAERGLLWITKDAPLTLSGNYMSFRNSVPGSWDKDPIYIPYYITRLQNHNACSRLSFFIPPNIISIKINQCYFSHLYLFYIFFLFSCSAGTMLVQLQIELAIAGTLLYIFSHVFTFMYQL